MILGGDGKNTSFDVLSAGMFLCHYFVTNYLTIFLGSTSTTQLKHRQRHSQPRHDVQPLGKLRLRICMSKRLRSEGLRIRLDTRSGSIRLSLQSLTSFTFLPWMMSLPGHYHATCSRTRFRNHSNYAMCAVNPSRVSSTFSDVALREVVDSIATHTASESFSGLLEIVNYNVEVGLFRFWPPSISISYASTGPTICLCRRTHRFADYERSELSESPKGRFAKVNTSSFSKISIKYLTMIKVGWDSQRWKSEGNAGRHRQIVFWEGSRATESWRLYQARAWICYHPSSWEWCTLPLSVPLGWSFAFPCLYADFLSRWVSFWTDHSLSDFSKKINPIILISLRSPSMFHAITLRSDAEWLLMSQSPLHLQPLSPPLPLFPHPHLGQLQAWKTFPSKSSTFFSLVRKIWRNELLPSSRSRSRTSSQTLASSDSHIQKKLSLQLKFCSKNAKIYDGKLKFDVCFRTCLNKCFTPFHYF